MALELDGAASALDEIKDSFGCGATSPDQLAHYWLLQAGLALFREDEAGVQRALISARQADEAFCTSTATRLVPLASRPSSPASDSRGTVSSEPPPAMALMTPAATPPTKMINASQPDTKAHRIGRGPPVPDSPRCLYLVVTDV